MFVCCFVSCCLSPRTALGRDCFPWANFVIVWSGNAAFKLGRSRLRNRRLGGCLFQLPKPKFKSMYRVRCKSHCWMGLPRFRSFGSSDRRGLSPGCDLGGMYSSVIEFIQDTPDSDYARCLHPSRQVPDRRLYCAWKRRWRCALQSSPSPSPSSSPLCRRPEKEGRDVLDSRVSAGIRSV